MCHHSLFHILNTIGMLLESVPFVAIPHLMTFLNSRPDDVMSIGKEIMPRAFKIKTEFGENFAFRCCCVLFVFMTYKTQKEVSFCI